MADRYFQHLFPNGLTLLGEKMPGMQSVAMTLLLPAGCATDPVDRCGSASVLEELALRGAGARDNRELTNYLDGLGLQRSSHVGVFHTRFGCAALGPKVLEGLSAYADIVRRPHLPEDGFEFVRDLALQSLEGIEDEPSQKLGIKLSEWYLPSPYGRNPMGKKEDLEKLTLDLMKADHARRYHASGSILALAGNIEFDEILDLTGKLFGDWETGETPAIELIPPPGPFHHEVHASEQTYIGIAYPSVQETDPDYYTVRMATEVLSGGMSSRLFTEVREKRGLCYSVGASYVGLKGLGSIFASAGTSNDRAQATLDCVVGELHRLTKGVTQAELDRAKIGLKASSIMAEESSRGRAGAIARDYFMRGRIRTLDEVKAAIDGVTLEGVNEYLKTHEPGPFTIVTVGPKALKLP